MEWRSWTGAIVTSFLLIATILPVGSGAVAATGDVLKVTAERANLRADRPRSRKH